MLRTLFYIVVYTCVLVLVWGSIVLVPTSYTRTGGADDSSPYEVAAAVGLSSVAVFLLLWGIGMWIIWKVRKKEDKCKGTVRRV